MTPKPGSSAAPGPSVWLRPAGPARLPVRPLLPTLGWQHQHPRPHLGDVHPPTPSSGLWVSSSVSFSGAGGAGGAALAYRPDAGSTPAPSARRTLGVLTSCGGRDRTTRGMAQNSRNVSLTVLEAGSARSGPAGLCSLRARGLTFLDLQMHLSNLCLHHHRAALSPHFPFSGVTG